MMVRKKLVLVTTIPETFADILQKQPNFLSFDFDVLIISSNSTKLREVAEQENVSYRCVPMVRRINVFHDAYSVLRMVWVLLTLRPDAVHSYTPKAALVAMLAAWICRVPVRVHTFTGLIWPTATGFKQKLLIWVDRLVCACATHIVPEGEGVKKDLQQFQITRKTLQVIGHGNIAGVDTGYFAPAAPGIPEQAEQLKKSLRIEEDAFVFCFVGRLNRDKGLLELVGAFSRLKDRNLHLLLVGGLDKTAPVPDEVLAQIEKNPRIHSLGFLSDVRPALAASNVLVLASYREGFPNVVLQAGAMQLPAIVTNISGCNEIVQPGFNGWIVPPRQEQALMNAMSVAINTPSDDLLILGENARSLIKKRFERNAHWQRMVDFYKNILSA